MGPPYDSAVEGENLYFDFFQRLHGADLEATCLMHADEWYDGITEEITWVPEWGTPFWGIRCKAVCQPQAWKVEGSLEWGNEKVEKSQF